MTAVGHRLSVPRDQTCCGQPGYNGGHRQQARAVARSQLQLLADFDFVVVPSASCAGMFINHYPLLLADDPHWHEAALDLAGRTRELSQFLRQQQWQPQRRTSDPRRLAHHTSCASRRETRSHSDTRQLLLAAGYQVEEPANAEICCGFGGSFAAKFDRLSQRLGHQKLDACAALAAEAVVSADLGCLLHLESVAGGPRQLPVYHVAELLAPVSGGRRTP
ncbi:MAG: Fe-S oxidoreductase [Pseudomonadales bacterium]|nr:Fe-S oxidoreductase [Pseudomonadales bacterium]